METIEFKSPEYTDELLNKVVLRCEKLIRVGLWDIRISQLRSWITNFKTREEKYLCAHLLDSLMYRSERMSESLCRHAIESTLPNSLHIYPENLGNWLNDLQSSRGSRILFVAVEGVKNGERQTAKSGQIVLRQYDRSGVVHKNHFVDVASLMQKIENEDVGTVVYIDDFCGTGKQFCDFYSHYELQNIPNDIEQMYIPLCCYEDGRSEVNKKNSNVNVHPVELLTRDNKFFCEKNGTFRGDNLNSIYTAKAYYKELLSYHGIRLKEPFGFGSLELTYAFKMSTPNNILPIFYTNKGSWKPLLVR